MASICSHRTSLVVVVLSLGPRPHAFQLAASSAPRTHDRVALCASAVNVVPNAVQDVEDRLKACLKELKTVNDDIKDAKEALKATPDSETKKWLTASIELKNTVLKEKATLEAEKKAFLEQETKEKDDEAKRVDSKTFYVYGLNEYDPKAKDTFVEDAISFREYQRLVPGGLRKVGGTDNKVVFTFEQLDDGEEYYFSGTFGYHSLSTLIEEVEGIAAVNKRRAIIDKRRALADEEAMAHASEALAVCFPGYKPVPALRKVFKWKDDVSAAAYAAVVDRQLSATTDDELENIDAAIAALLASNGMSDNSDYWEIEFDGAFVDENGIVVLIEAKSRLTGHKVDKFNSKLGVVAMRASKNDPKYSCFKEKRILPIAYGNWIHPKPEVMATAEIADILIMGRNGGEFGRLLNRGAPSVSDEDDKATLCDYLRKFVRNEQ